MMARLWPRSMQSQILITIALALLFAQAISAALLYRSQAARRDAALVHAAAMRLISANKIVFLPRQDGHEYPPGLMSAVRQQLVERTSTSPLRSGETRNEGAEEELRDTLADQGIEVRDVVVVVRPISDDEHSVSYFRNRAAMLRHHAPPPDHLIVAGVQMTKNGGWLAVRVPVPRTERAVIASLIGQTVLLYVILVGAIALILRRITRPLAALTTRLERFAATRDVDGPLDPEGPDDVRRLITAHNAMEARIAALLDEKDVMLGAIGHDLKTPLAALRVRIESVEDEVERARMAATIEDITRSLDDILSLARVGRPSDPKEPVELSALVAQVTEEFEDMGEPVSFTDFERITLPLRATWLRRALRNLISNAVRYGKVARVALSRESGEAVIRIHDDGPGIPEADIARMLEPFARGEPSRSSETGGAGLGLTLARAIAEQHGGTLSLANRRDADGAIRGLTATLALPLT